jgi:methylmalonyl-CoA mutase cobalamin-binding subunit
MTAAAQAAGLDRRALFPEPALPDWAALVAEGRRLARTNRVGPCAFLEEYGVESEAAFKRRAAAQGLVTTHAQIGFRDAALSRRAWAEIHARVARAGHRVHRYGICLDQNMGYPQARRAGMPRGTGMILSGPEEFAALTRAAPVAPHFGDFMLGLPAAVENVCAALAAGSTVIGNMGQYFTYRLPRWDDELATTAATVTALALIAAQPVEVLVHSNLDDGFVALFTDMACALGAVLLERDIVEGLLGAKSTHCFGHTFSDPLTRLAFQHALAEANPNPGSMVYGNTVSYRDQAAVSYAGLASYLMADIVGQRAKPSGHAVNPVPVTETLRIPDIDEIVDAQLFANRLIERTRGWMPLFDLERVEAIARDILAGGRAFHARVRRGLAEAGVDLGNPVEFLLAMRRIGPKRLEELFGPGAEDRARPRGRRPVVPATTLVELEAQGRAIAAGLPEQRRSAIAAAGLKACIATSDVHEYGKILLESTLEPVGVGIVDAGINADPHAVVAAAKAGGAHCIALSTFNGFALDYVAMLQAEMEKAGLAIPVYVGGRLNQVPEQSNTSLPVDVGAELAKRGAVVCRKVEDMLEGLARLAAGAT